MTPISNRSRLLRFPEGTLINYKYVLTSPASRESANRSKTDSKNSAGAKSDCVAPIGHGGSSVVFLAQQAILEQSASLRTVPRAIKFYMVSPALARKNDLDQVETANTQNVLNEIKNLTCLQHDNILKVIDTGVCEHNGMAVNYLVTEYIPGPTLRDVIACGHNQQRSKRRIRDGELVYRQIRRDPALIVRILDQLCAAIEYLHAQNTYHCDIAPKNIFIHRADGCRPILGDFTLGRQIDDWDCYDRILIGGAMRYAPPPVHRHFRHEIGPREFASYAVHWDMYGFAKSALELVDLAPSSSFLPWKNALIRYLDETMIEENGVTAARLHRRIAKLL